VFGQFRGSGCGEGHACDDEHVVGEHAEPFEFLVEGLDAIGSTTGIRKELLGLGGWTYASCRMPAVARRRGERPTLEIISAAILGFLRAMALPMMRREQKKKRKSHPSRP
jgi:hypothetical protein